MKFTTSTWVAIGLVVLLAGWLATSSFHKQPETVDQTPVARSNEVKPAVRILTQYSTPIAKEIVFQGMTEASRSLIIKAEVAGRVIEVNAKKGSQINYLDSIANLHQRDLLAQEKKAKALIKQYELEYQGAQRLINQGHAAQTRLAEALAELEGARADFKRANFVLEAIRIRAPFAALLEDVYVEVGELVLEGQDIAKLVDYSPYLIVGNLSEMEVKNVSIGQKGIAKLITGEEVHGVIRYVASTADEATRTFRIEMEIENQDPVKPISGGVTAQLFLELDKQEAHYISPALLNLNHKGKLGVKVLDTDDRVAFLPIDVSRADARGMWVTGLPHKVKLITVGQGFVEPGALVTALEQAPVISHQLPSKPEVTP
jgi:multidrug efflux system membrane fusion protein